MDPNYNIEEARVRLEHFIELRTPNDAAVNQPYPLLKIQDGQYNLVEFKDPQTWRMTASDGDTDGECEEAVFRVQGIICQKDLPPVEKSNTPFNTLKKKRLYMRQAVTLTGLSSTHFDEMVSKFSTIYRGVVKCLGEGKVKHWEAGVYEGHAAISVHSRYFTLRRDAPQERNLPFEAGVDVDGTLAKLRGQDLIHGHDNKVKYMQRTEENGKTRYVPLEPAKFETGDIVEALVAFVCIPLQKGSGYIFAPQLRALTLMDDSVRRHHASEAKAQPSSSGVKLKRRSDFQWVDEEGEEDVSKRMHMTS